ncbi:hypothetical protein GC098_31200 [Paenibacillus sp. LMG 31458]|uniref:Transposon Tn7 transposition protein TnsD C-terminal domain-containing protein n=1 Tax=Paenibacillus phytorum TaxID=2654977 RepID=A0ABX1Y4H0_9BACL|nr:TnsD family Tn7-like transposition protein [Paenibacillus phytorum]NOU75778.1 hypothetical protein [Paenibacillus phytorum]
MYAFIHKELNSGLASKSPEDIAQILLDEKKHVKQNLGIFKRDAYRQELLSILEGLVIEGKTRYKIRKLNNKIYVWLIANDRNWLDEVVPSSQRSSRSMGN